MTTYDRELLAANVSKEIFGPDTTLVPVSYFQKKENEQDLQDKVLHVRILSCTMGASNVTTRINTTSFLNVNKRQKSFQNATYNRCFLVADLARPPHCAMIITRNGKESNALLKLTQAETFVGTDYYILEPNMSNQTIGDTTPIISLSCGNPSLYPLLYSDASFPSTESIMAHPTFAGETNYFILRNQKIVLNKVDFVLSDTSCTGIQCDRQKSHAECTCIHTTASTNFVYSFDVTFTVPSNIDKENGTQTVHNFRSLRTTSLFFKDFEEHASTVTTDAEQRNRHVYRKQIKLMVNHINDLQGWNIVGWFKLGEIADNAAPTDKVENYNLMTVHISYLMPTRIADTQTPLYELLLIQNNPVP
jgi:hypothetical protein